MAEPRRALRVAILAGADTLAAAGVPSPRADAEILAAHLLGVPRTRLGLVPLIDPEVAGHYQQLIDRRAARIPLQYLTGSASLGPISVQVGPGVFVPRPETEVLVDWAIKAIAATDQPVVVDLFTGSGAIALAIAAARPDAVVYGVERAPGALAWARRNAELQADEGRTAIRLLGGDVFDERLMSELDGAADLVTANPPYVPEATPVEPEVRDHDPAEAVFAGPDGLAVIRPLLSVAAALLKPGGRLAIEHDASQKESAPALLAARRLFADVVDHQDLAGRPRFMTATRVSLRP
jgi:release factor glutamine methyltransferase